MVATGPDGGTAGGTLYVVATPIGNLGDVTLRALEVLKAVPLVAAEDTRITRRLFARYEITTRLVSFHARSGATRVAALLAHLRGGADLAVVTDAGTPIVSDPGEDLVGAWADEGGTVVAIPGASAVLAAVASSGIAGPRWGFEGFLPRGGRERKERLARIAADDRSTILFEAPGRLGPTLRDLASACGGDRQAAVCRELTKLHEQLARGTLGELAAAVGSAIPERGEIVVVVAGAADGPVDEEADASQRLEAAKARVDELVAAGTSRSEAARRVAGETGLPRRDVYGGTASR
ncbi:MAG TPA: 16S rRNA (cytidine(1402)-2'-O)-methyltransferase [Candidatus Limnocylindrales bacterium]|nr:16S rRNA (cytidine(1402)-2'-O)-methyltransferase [Candidatus Limnocylindrales bacterium]